MKSRKPKQDREPERGRSRYRDPVPDPGPAIWTPQTALNNIPNPPNPPPTTHSNPPTPIPFFHLLSLLKTTPRAGWSQVGIPHGESIADHMYRMAVMAMIPPPALASRLDIPRCVSMALVHDMAECLVGDFTPRDIAGGVISRTEKGRREGGTMRFIRDWLLKGTGYHDGDLLRDGEGEGREVGAGDSMMGLFEEYEANQTLEARFVHDVDKLEMLLQVLEYERASGRRLDEFYHVVGEIGLVEMREWAGVVVQEREELFARIEAKEDREKESGRKKKEKKSWSCGWWRRRKKGES